MEGIQGMMKLVLKVKQNMTHETLHAFLSDETISKLQILGEEALGNDEAEYKLVICLNQFFSLIGADNILTQLHSFILPLL